MLFKKNVMVESLLFIGAGAGEKITQSRSKMDRLRNTGCIGTNESDEERNRC